MLLNSREFKFFNNYRNVYVKSSAKREYRDENVTSAPLKYRLDPYLCDMHKSGCHNHKNNKLWDDYNNCECHSHIAFCSKQRVNVATTSFCS